MDFCTKFVGEGLEEEEGKARSYLEGRYFLKRKTLMHEKNREGHDLWELEEEEGRA